MKNITQHFNRGPHPIEPEKTPILHPNTKRFFYRTRFLWFIVGGGIMLSNLLSYGSASVYIGEPRKEFFEGFYNRKVIFSNRGIDNLAKSVLFRPGIELGYLLTPSELKSKNI